MKWLGDIIVGPDFQPHHFVYDIVAATDDDDGDVGIGANGTRERQAILSWQHEVEQNEVDTPLIEPITHFVTVAGARDQDTPSISRIRVTNSSIAGSSST